jgi:hypothetical protein
MREPIKRDAEEFRKFVVEVEPKQVQAVLDFAQGAWRRSLTVPKKMICGYSTRSCAAGAAARYGRADVDRPSACCSRFPLSRGKGRARPESRAGHRFGISYAIELFPLVSAPDDELGALGNSGKLHQPEVLAAQTRRMLKDPKVRRLATEFGCQWLHVRDLETLDEKSERHYPTFASLRGAMQEEAVLFFMDLFQADRSVLSLLDADYTFVNGPLAKHYGIEVNGNNWQRVDGLHAQGRGGVIGFASTLAKQSGASRTSPILRGNWLSEVVLGEKLPRPPKGVPVLPEEAPQGLTERQLIERHSSDEACVKCHQRIDPFGFALEGFDAIGRARSKGHRRSFDRHRGRNCLMALNSKAWKACAPIWSPSAAMTSSASSIASSSAMPWVAACSSQTSRCLRRC